MGVPFSEHPPRGVVSYLGFGDMGDFDFCNVEEVQLRPDMLNLPEVPWMPQLTSFSKLGMMFAKRLAAITRTIGTSSSGTCTQIKGLQVWHLRLRFKRLVCVYIS